MSRFHQLTPALLLSLSALASAQDQRPPGDPRSNHVLGTWEAFLGGAEGSQYGQFDPGTGRLREARGALRVAPRGIDAANAAAVGRLVLRQLAPALGLDNDALVERGVVGRPGGLFHVAFAQELGGVPVLGAELHLRLSAAGDLMSVMARGLRQDLLLDTTPTIERSDATLLAAVGLPGATEEAEAWAPELVILPEGEGSLAWLVVVDDPALTPSAWHVLVDAHSGEFLRATEGIVSGDVAGKAEGFGTPTGTMELKPEAKLPLSHLRVRFSDWSSALLKISADPDVSEALISPDGTRVFWVTSEDGDRELWTAAADGSGVTRLTDNDAEEYDLATDYTGSIVFFSSDVTGDLEIWSVLADGGALTQLTSSPGIDRGVSVPHGGTTMIWESDRDGDLDIYTAATTAGAPATALTSNTIYDGQAVIGGDGTKIAFISGKNATKGKLYSMDPDGTDQLQLIFGKGFCADPSISSDGAAVLFERWRISRADLSDGSMHSAGAGRATHTPKIWAATTDGMAVQEVDAESDAYQVDPFLAGGNEYAAWAERNEDGDLDIVHLELLTLATLRIPLPGDQTNPTLSEAGQLGAIAGGGVTRVSLIPGTGSFDVFTDETGSFSVPFADGSSVTLEARLRGKHVRVDDVSLSQKNLREIEAASAPDASADLLFNDPGTHALKTPQVTAYVQHSKAHDTLASAFGLLGYPAPLPFDAPLLCEVNDAAGTRNAYYSFLKNRTHYFVGGGTTTPNTCFDTIVYHEYGHYMDEMFGQALGLGGLRRVGNPLEHSFAVSEGIGDWVAIITGGTSVIGDGWKGAGTWARNYTKRIKDGGSSDRQWDCLDCFKVGDFYNGGAPRWEEHLHGEAIAGFGHDVIALCPLGIGDLLLADVIGLHPVDMPDAVAATFDVDFVLFGGAHFDAICLAARRHGFDCPPAPDYASHGCVFLDWCGPLKAVHKDTGPERLGLVVDSEPGCEFPDGDEDGLGLPTSTFFGGETISVPLVVSVDPELLLSGRYGGKKKADGLPNPLHYLYVNIWILVDEGGVLGSYQLLGTGSGEPGTGVASFPIDCWAIDPDADWAGDDLDVFPISLTLPEVSVPSAAILRIRLDYGEDGGRGDLKALNPLNDGLYFGECGPSRSGEVEEYQILLVPED